jgi:hypothetical protein
MLLNEKINNKKLENSRADSNNASVSIKFCQGMFQVSIKFQANCELKLCPDVIWLEITVRTVYDEGIWNISNCNIDAKSEVEIWPLCCA